MKKSAFRLFVPAIVAVLFLSACSLGLVPASARDSAATVSLKLGSLDSTVNSTSRAIAQGSGYLYLRTYGGPTGESGPFYGPYSVAAGGTFSTTDLPAGSYKGIGILYSVNKLDETKTFSYNGGSYTFRQLMQLSDDVLQSKDLSIDGDTLMAFFDGEVSTGMTGAETLTDGVTTALSATLIPICGGKYWVDLPTSTSLSLPSTSSTVKKFYELYGLSAASGSTISCTLTPGSSGTATIGTVALYGADGKPLPSSVNVGTITAPKTVSFTANGDSTAYLYIEYQATDLTLSFGGMTSSLSCTFAGNSNVANKFLFVAVVDSSLASSTTTTTPSGNAVAGELLSVAGKRASVASSVTSVTSAGLLGVGIATLDASGNATVTIYDYVTGAVMSPIVGHSYYYTAFVDVNGRYTVYKTFAAAKSAGLIGQISANYGDYTWTSKKSSTSITATAGTNAISFKLSDFTALTEVTFYVTNAAAGSGDGMDLANTCTLATAFSKAGSYTGANDMVGIVLTESVSVDSVLTVPACPSISLYCYNTSGFKISLTSASACILVNATGFAIEGVILDGSGVSNRTSSALSVSTGSSVFMFEGSKITNMAGSVNGSGINVAGTLRMQGATVSGCTSQCGGGIYIYNGNVGMSANSSITGCTASSDGGGVYVAGGSFSMDTGSTITGCTAGNYGGGIYTSSGGVSGNISGVTGNTGTTDLTNNVQTNNYYNAATHSNTL